MEHISALRTKMYLFWVRQQGKSGYGGLFAVILREICGYIGDYIVLIQLHSRYFRWFNVVERQWSSSISISAPFQYSREGRYITFHSDQLLYTGGLRKNSHSGRQSAIRSLCNYHIWSGKAAPQHGSRQIYAWIGCISHGYVCVRGTGSG